MTMTDSVTLEVVRSEAEGSRVWSSISLVWCTEYDDEAKKSWAVGL